MRIALLSTYDYIYQFVAKNRILKKDLPERFIHFHLVCVFATGILMWSYALVAYFTIDHPLPWIIGVITSIIHLISPLLYRVNNNRFLNMNIFLGAGMLHQATFGFFCGGFLSNIIVWFGILPMLAGVICGRKGIITWLTICTFVSLFFLVLQMLHFDFPYRISPMGLLISQALVTFGWIYTSSIVIWGFLISVENHQKEIENKKEGIQNLIFVITHDISTPISIVTGHSRILKSMGLPNQANTSVDKILNATNSILNIVTSVKELYAMELGKSRISMSSFKVAKTIFMLQENFADKLDAKNLKLIIKNNVGDLEIKSNAELILHQILGNLLSNAIKFSPENSEVHIDIDKNTHEVIISLRDFGIGIPANLLTKIFEISAYTSRLGTAGERGTGFGLPIVKTYVEKLNGRIKVHSLEESEGGDHGTTFTLELPL